jgi:hypothetical protein
MAEHRTVDLELQVSKPGNAWELLHNWREASQCSHHQDVRYLFLYARAGWGKKPDVFSIAIQYSDQIGKQVDVSQPAQIVKDDVLVVLSEFQDFVASNLGKH